MMNPREWLKKLIDARELSDDGSEALAKEWLNLLDSQEDLQALLQNKAFKQIIAKLEQDFVNRMNLLVNQDPELKATKRMFIRTVGMKDAEDRIQKQMVEYLHEEADVTPSKTE